MGHIYRFHTQVPVMHFSAVLCHLMHQGYRQHEAGCLGPNTQILSDPTFLEPFDCNIVTTDSNTLSVFSCNFFQYKSWLFIGVS